MTYVDAAQAPLANTGQIKLHGPEAFAAMRKAGSLCAQALDMLSAYVQPGTTTEKLNQLANEFARDNNAIPAPLYYRGLPKASAPASITSSATASPMTSLCAKAKSSMWT
jgi:methionyl aminopeptidase